MKAGYDPAKAPPAELLIIADRTTPYRLLLEVMFSAKQKEAGYKHFRLIVQKYVPARSRRSSAALAAAWLTGRRALYWSHEARRRTPCTRGGQSSRSTSWSI